MYCDSCESVISGNAGRLLCSKCVSERDRSYNHSIRHLRNENRELRALLAKRTAKIQRLREMIDMLKDAVNQ